MYILFPLVSQTEETNTREALSAEQREASLRETVARHESRLADLQEFVSSAADRVTCAYQERDAARDACRASQSELAALRTNHSNLQQALEHLERGMLDIMCLLTFVSSNIYWSRWRSGKPR